MLDYSPPLETLLMRNKMSMIKTLSLLGILSVQVVIGNVCAQSKTTPNPPRPYQNSMNVRALPDIIDEAISLTSNIPEDPFDPSAKRKKQQEILKRFEGIEYFIPNGLEQTSPQNLSTLFFFGNEERLSFGTPERAWKRFAYLTLNEETPQCNGSPEAIGYTVDMHESWLRACDSDLASTQCGTTGPGSANIQIAREQARRLSGNVERYITFNRLDRARRLRETPRANNGTCDYDYLGRDLGFIESPSFSVRFVEKGTSNNIFRLRFSR